ncbi:Starch synthase, catalytic domain [Dillenia turbinata]|uniref:starch synthase n=1 Tax=Dillenia turbinata TaxID=194707 RepID=A0AAN8V3Z8_9MAGN
MELLMANASAMSSSSTVPLIPSLTLRFQSARFSLSSSLRCFRQNGEANGMLTGHDKAELESQDNIDISKFRSHDDESGIKQNDIWQLFSEAQQNILYLNRQRLAAIEELERTKREKQHLLNRLEQLEAEKHVKAGKDNLSILWELLLRLDAMVLTGMIGNKEASDFRRMIMDSNISRADVFSQILQKRDDELLTELRSFSGKNKKISFHIAHICTEMAPVVSVGSLAPYVTGLSCALQRKGHMVEIILPKYTVLDLDEVQGLREVAGQFYSYFNGQLHENKIWTGIVCGIGVTFIQPVHYLSFFHRERIYGYSDDFERFAYFCRASLDYIVKSGKHPDVLHIHNWHTAIVGPLFWDLFVNQGLRGTRILLSCQGFETQCLEQPDKLALCGLDASSLHRPDRLQDNTGSHLVNILKGGVVYSNKVVMMSSMHSKGWIIKNLSHGLESTLATHKEKLLVAPFGFDDSIWDPSKDKFLPERYTAEDTTGKAACKVALQRRLGFVVQASTILVGCIFSENLEDYLEDLERVVWIASKKGIQFIFMETSKMPSIRRALESFQEELKDDTLRFVDKYDEALSHLIFAGSDIILCQSFHDPVLQVPLKALKYGTAPIAMRFKDYGFRQDHDLESTKFSQYIRSTFANMSLTEALDEIKNNPVQWHRKIKDAMAMDFSWDAECYDLHFSAYSAIKNLLCFVSLFNIFPLQQKSFLGVFTNSVDKFDEEDQVSTIDKATRKPLLEEEATTQHS